MDRFGKENRRPGFDALDAILHLAEGGHNHHGMRRVSGSSLSRLQVSNPSMIGIITSNKIRSGRSRDTRCNASSPCVAVMTL